FVSLIIIHIIRKQTRDTLYPYTTLFRSTSWVRARPVLIGATMRGVDHRPVVRCDGQARGGRDGGAGTRIRRRGRLRPGRLHRARSEEHTSELQSRENLVCRLLLEKKKLP